MESTSNPHHFVFGKIKDFITGAIIDDTHDEQYKQKIAQFLVYEKGFDKKNIKIKNDYTIQVGNRKSMIKIDFCVWYENKIVCLIQYAPGSLVTRRLSTLAISRCFVDYQIPIVIVTNGEDAEILDGNTGKLMNTGFRNFPNYENIHVQFTHFPFKSIDKIKRAQASRIAYACIVDGACPCDTDICTIE
jgi:type I restriction and modification enzyme subunit R-like protein